MIIGKKNGTKMMSFRKNNQILCENHGMTISEQRNDFPHTVRLNVFMLCLKLPVPDRRPHVLHKVVAKAWWEKRTKTPDLPMVWHAVGRDR
jgi:hypothetical protein